MSDPAPQQQHEAADADVRVKEEESLTLPSPTKSVASTEANAEPPSSTPSRSIRRTEAERLAIFEEDPCCQAVEPHRVLCRSCQKWIKLQTTYSYSLTNWHAHRQRCFAPRSRPTPSKPSFSPGSRVATAERKIVLLNDPQVRSCSPRNVQCGRCKTLVVLDGDVDYDLTRWIEHKETCITMVPAPITPQGSVSHIPRVFPGPSTSSITCHVSVGRSPRSPIPVAASSSSNSTETTAVVDRSPKVKVGVKRGREEEREAAEDSRPTNRPRPEDSAAEKEGPSPWGWIMQPWKEFARGFREGLGTP